MAVPIRDKLIKVQALPNIILNADGEVQFDSIKLKHAKHIGGASVGLQGNAGLKIGLTNRYCPALPRIPKIAQMCCNIFQASYEHIYHTYQQ